MKINYGYIRPENRVQYESLMNLKDKQGHYALTSSHRKIVEYVGSMPREAGCFACEDTINEQSIRVKTRKTLKRHLKYLAHIGALSVTIMKGRRIFRLESVDGCVVSQKDYRVKSGMVEYSYANDAQDANEGEIIVEQVENNDVSTSEQPLDKGWFEAPLFFETGAGIFAQETEPFASETANFAPILCKNKEESNRYLPPKGSLVPSVDAMFRPDLLAARADAGETARPRSEGPLDPRVQGIIDLKKTKEEDWDEPLVGRVGKTPRTQQERQHAARQDHAKGHLVNPLGITNNRPKKLNAKLARDIAPSGAVTVPQLYRHLIKRYDAAFGEGIVAQMLPDDKSAITAWFGNIRQKFIEACKYEPTNRDVADYFDWILHPDQAAKLLSASKYGDSATKGSVHFRQLMGLAHIRKFYDCVIRRRLGADKLPNEPQTTLETQILRDVANDIEERFRDMKAVENDPIMFSLVITMHGLALAAQYLHETKGLDATECRIRIIHDLTEYTKKCNDKAKAKDTLDRAVGNAKANRGLLDKECVWYEVEKYTDGLVDEILRNYENGKDGR